MEMLGRHNVQLITAAKMQLLLQPTDVITQEARVVLSQTKTLTGCKLLHAQITHGLVPTLKQWQTQLPTEKLSQQCRDILTRSRWIQAYLTSISIAMIGPPNSGKSTLLNTLLGRTKAIVTDLAGTTRDTVEAEVTLEPFCLKLLDTAGLDATLDQPLDQAAQGKSLKAMQQADIIMVVLDGSRDAQQLQQLPLDRIADRPVITLLNKCDLPSRLQSSDLPEHLLPALPFCAQQPEQIPTLLDHIQTTLGLDKIDIRSPLAFTLHQQDLLEQVIGAQTIEQIQSLLQEFA